VVAIGKPAPTFEATTLDIAITEALAAKKKP